MKIKNYYIIFSAMLFAFSLLSAFSSAYSFMTDKLLTGVVCLILCLGFSFVAGIFAHIAFMVSLHNQEVDWLHDLAEELRYEQEEPFGEFEDGNTRD